MDKARTLEQLAKDFEYLPLEDAADALFTRRDLTEKERSELSFGRRISSNETDEVTAAFAPDGTLVALLKNKGAEAKPELVFATAS